MRSPDASRRGAGRRDDRTVGGVGARAARRARATGRHADRRPPRRARAARRPRSSRPSPARRRPTTPSPSAPAVAVVAAVVLPATADAFVDGSSYGSERRFALGDATPPAARRRSGRVAARRRRARSRRAPRLAAGAWAAGAALAVLGLAGIALAIRCHVPVYAKPSRRIANIPAFRMDLFQDGSLVKSYQIGIGYPEFPLPQGLRKASTIIFNPTWTPPDSPWVAKMKNVTPGETVEAGEQDQSAWTNQDSDRTAVADSRRQGAREDRKVCVAWLCWVDE